MRQQKHAILLRILLNFLLFIGLLAGFSGYPGQVVQAVAPTIEGIVTDAGSGLPIEGATVRAVGPSEGEVTTEASGYYSIWWQDPGTYNVTASHPCYSPETAYDVVVTGGGTTEQDFALTLRVDDFGYYSQVQTPSYIEAGTILSLTGDDASLNVTLPFAFPFYGINYTDAWVATNGYLNFLAPNSAYSNNAIPTTTPPNGAIYAFWDDLYVDASASVWTELLDSPNRFVIEWRNVTFVLDNALRIDFEVVLYEDGRILVQHRNIDSDYMEQGYYATLGIENADGTIALQTSYNEPVIAHPEFAIMYQRATVGTLEGTVTDAVYTLPISGATIQAVGSITTYDTTTDASGSYSFPTIAEDTYNVTACKFGYLPQTASDVVVTGGGTTVQDFALAPAPLYSVSGYVLDQYLQPIAGATVTIIDTPIAPATTDDFGYYSFASVPEGSYNLTAEGGRCSYQQTLHLDLTANTTDFNFELQVCTDAFGYYCQVRTPAYIEANTVLPLTGDDASLQVALPFAFPFYGISYTDAWVCTNGFLNFLGSSTALSNTAIPASGIPNAAIYPFWDDLYVDTSANVSTEILTSPNRFVIEWRNARTYSPATFRMDFEVVLYEDGRILTQYRNISADDREQGSSATLGIENEAGTIALQYSCSEAAIGSPEFAVMYLLPPFAFVEGTVTDFNDGLPINGATVKALQDGNTVRVATTDADGFYDLQVPTGVYDIEASLFNYQSEMATLTIDTVNATYTQDFALKTPRGVVTPIALDFLIPIEKTKTLTLTNTGSLVMTFDINELGGDLIDTSVMGSATPHEPNVDLTPPGIIVSNEKNPAYDPSARTTEGLDNGGMPSAIVGAASVGDVLKSWTPEGLALPWGVGFDGNVWLSDPSGSPTLMGKAYDVDGNSLGLNWTYDAGGSWWGDMAYDSDRGWMCSVNVGGDNGIYAWNPLDGDIVGSITGVFPWTETSQRGLAYRPDDDSFYIGGWNQNIVYHIAGFSHPTPGQVLDQFSFAEGISGLAWNPAYNVIWVATNSPTDTIYELSAAGEVLGTLAHPNPAYNGAGLEMDAYGNLWMVDQSTATVYLVDSGLSALVDVPWLSESPVSGTLPIEGSIQIRVTVNTTGLEPGIYQAMLVIKTNSGRQPDLWVPVRLIYPDYYVGVNAGDGAYTDTQGWTWSADQSYTSGSWGYINKRASTGNIKQPIAGTEDDKLYQSYRQSPTEYRFDLPTGGLYRVELYFAEPTQSRKVATRMFDVIAELNQVLLPAHCIACEVGTLAADSHVFSVTVNDGQLNLRLVERRGYAPPIVSAIRVMHWPDL